MGKHKRFALLAAVAALLVPMVGLTTSPGANAVGGTFNQNTPITFGCGVTGACNAAQYPSGITQFGMSTTITDVNVTLSGITHSYKGDLDVMLISPSGSALVLTSDNCNATDATTKTFTFDDAAAGPLTSGLAACASGTYDPSNGAGGAGDEVYPTPATISSLAGFNGQNPNGTWNLWVRDDQNGDTGQITSWSITITTASNAPITIPAFGATGSGVSSPYPVPIAVSGKTGAITDVNLTIPGLAHTWPGDLSMVLQSPSGTAVRIMSSNCGSADILNKDFTFDDAAATVIGAGSCTAGGTFKVTTNAPGSLPAPAPAAPYAAALSAFNGESPNGQWKLFINDAASADGGWISASPTLAFTTTDVIPPDTLLVGKKPQNTIKTKVKVKFKSTEANSTFKCKLDGANYKPCTSPFKASNLKLGKHKLFIKATDASGNTDPKPLKIKWKIFKAKTEL
jgi:subtilisin-like proprotein convertase family protein